MNQLTSQQYWKTAKSILSYQLTIYPLGFVLSFPLANKTLDFGKCPNIQTILIDFFKLLILTEFFFYTGHRIFHTSFLYKHVHKIHHEWKSPIGIAAIYSHWLEHIHTMVDAVVPAMLIGTNIHILYMWTTLSVTNIILHHSGIVDIYGRSIVYHHFHQ